MYEDKDKTKYSDLNDDNFYDEQLYNSLHSKVVVPTKRQLYNSGASIQDMVDGLNYGYGENSHQE